MSCDGVHNMIDIIIQITFEAVVVSALIAIWLIAKETMR